MTETKYKLEAVTSEEECSLFYSAKDEPIELGCIGHLRGDFGRGNEFYTTWFPHKNDELNDKKFKTAFNELIDALREKGGILVSRNAMDSYCRKRNECRLNNAPFGVNWGFRIEIGDFLVYIRCFPMAGNYDFYAFCYDKQMLQEKLRVDQITAKNPTYSPWGKVDSCHYVCDGVYKVSTASHGGYMIELDKAGELLSAEAQECGYVADGYISYEEDCDAPIVIRELLDKDIIKAPEGIFTEKEYSEIINNSLKHWNYGYWCQYESKHKEKGEREER